VYINEFKQSFILWLHMTKDMKNLTYISMVGFVFSMGIISSVEQYFGS